MTGQLDELANKVLPFLANAFTVAKVVLAQAASSGTAANSATAATPHRMGKRRSLGSRKENWFLERRNA
eukprot:CAMPEP_0171636948 /NCGR_PEP_ID=MMETSP0990-20121206/27802_1 /TAXON_ID=483369 /ORGANISM="non described non described, Strain CCMP2098" /LENGTH=68 /DNA_ID=CAMNT_0012209353 /DNA_START=291 /DNA_END=498 /DNA_ORIENTATION=+